MTLEKGYVSSADVKTAAHTVARRGFLATSMALPALSSRRESRNSAPAPAPPARAAASQIGGRSSGTGESSFIATPIHARDARHVGVSFGGVGMARRVAITGDLPHADPPPDESNEVINQEDYVALELEVARLREVLEGEESQNLDVPERLHNTIVPTKRALIFITPLTLLTRCFA